LPPGVALLLGTGVHRGAEHNFRQKIESHEDLPAAEIVEAAVSAFEAETHGEYALTDDEASVGAAKVLGQAKDKLADMAEVHAIEQAPDYQPLLVEHATRIEFPGATHDLLGITDLRDDKQRVTDFKTAARKKAQSEVDKSIQLTIYAAAYQIDHGEPCSEVRFDTITKTKTPQRQLLRSTRTRADFAALVARVNATLAGINAGIFVPASPGDWVCDPKWCGYWATCPYVNSERCAAAKQKG